MSNLCHTDGSSFENESVANSVNSRNNPCLTRTDSETEQKVEIDPCRICQMDGHFANSCPNEEVIRQITEQLGEINKIRAEIARLEKLLKKTHLDDKK
jgi:hypothetical protein